MPRKKAGPNLTVIGHESSEPDDLTAIRIQLLGDFTVRVEGRYIVASSWHLRKAGQIVKLLALAPGHALDREEIMGTLWPDAPPDAAAKNFRSTLYVARHVLAPDAASRWLIRAGSQIKLARSQRVWVDVEAFEQAAVRARHSREPARYEVALELYSGELLPDERYAQWAESRRWILHEEYLSLLLELASIYEADDDFDSAISTLQRALTSDPTHEDAHAGLMRIYAGMGLPHQALRQYEHLCQALLNELDTQPDATTTQLMTAIRRGEVIAGVRPERGGGRARQPVTLHNIPLSLSSFVGRDRQLAEIANAVSSTRLLALTGPPGCGKTRLAIEYARTVTDQYPDGVWFVDLEALTDPAALADEVASALPIERWLPVANRRELVPAIRPRTLLLILNGCEHLIDACRHLVLQLLTSCPGVSIVATSQESLELPGEIVRQVPPLAMPDRHDKTSASGATEPEAIQLFRERAAAVEPDFAMTPATRSVVTRICEVCDGLPLAIEMAATHVKALSVEEIVTRLGDPLSVLTNGSRLEWRRGPSFRAALEASYHRLHPPEQALFRRLAVFNGGWTLDVAERIASAWQDLDEDLIGQLESLTSKSLIVHHASSGFSMLNTVRAFGLEQLHANNEYERALEIHHFTHSP
jgi:predicted ATPase/DNA-binding SARP family transcriptional activator